MAHKATSAEEFHWEACIHEAGHAVVTIACGGRVGNLDVSREEGRGGQCSAQFPNQDWRSLTTFLMAGFWAQHHFGKTRYPWACCSLDRKMWEETLRKYDAPEGTEEELFQLAERLVLQHEDAIMDVAVRLDLGWDPAKVCSFLTEALPVA